MVKTQKKTYVTLVLAVVVCMSLSYAAYAGIGAESSTQAANSTYTATPAVSNIPPYPGIDSSAAFMTAAQPAQYYQDIPQYLQQGTVPMYGNTMYPSQGTMPSMYGDQAGSMYTPYGAMPNMYGDQTGSMYAPYGTMPNMYGGQTGGMYPMPQTGEGTLQYPLPYTMNPYDPYQGYGQGQYGQTPWNQQGSGYGTYNYGTADQAYNQAKQAFDSKDYWTAMTKFQEVAARFPQSDLVDNAYYWMGEINYGWKNFPAAIQSFQTVLYSYPQGNKVPDAHVKMGFAYAEMRQYGMARSILNDVASRYQDNTRIRGLALKKLNELNNQ